MIREESIYQPLQVPRRSKRDRHDRWPVDWHLWSRECRNSQRHASGLWPVEQLLWREPWGCKRWRRRKGQPFWPHLRHSGQIPRCIPWSMPLWRDLRGHSQRAEEGGPAPGCHKSGIPTHGVGYQIPQQRKPSRESDRHRHLWRLMRQGERFAQISVGSTKSPRDYHWHAFALWWHFSQESVRRSWNWFDLKSKRWERRWSRMWRNGCRWTPRCFRFVTTPWQQKKEGWTKSSIGIASWRVIGTTWRKSRRRSWTGWFHPLQHGLLKTKDLHRAQRSVIAPIGVQPSCRVMEQDHRLRRCPSRHSHQTLSATSLHLRGEWERPLRPIWPELWRSWHSCLGSRSLTLAGQISFTPMERTTSSARMGTSRRPMSWARQIAPPPDTSSRAPAHWTRPKDGHSICAELLFTSAFGKDQHMIPSMKPTLDKMTWSGPTCSQRCSSCLKYPVLAEYPHPEHSTIFATHKFVSWWMKTPPRRMWIWQNRWRL